MSVCGWKTARSLSRVTRTIACAIVAAVFASNLTVSIAELGATGAFDLVTSFRELEGSSAVGTELEFGATLILQNKTSSQQSVAEVISGWVIKIRTDLIIFCLSSSLAWRLSLQSWSMMSVRSSSFAEHMRQL